MFDVHVLLTAVEREYSVDENRGCISDELHILTNRSPGNSNHGSPYSLRNASTLSQVSRHLHATFNDLIVMSIIF